MNTGNIIPFAIGALLGYYIACHFLKTGQPA